LGEYGNPTYKPLNEDYPKQPIRIYDAAKLMGEHTTQYYQRTFGVDAVILRFGTTFGPGKTERHGNMGVTSQIIEAPAKGLPFRIAKGGDQIDDFTYNKDCALGIYLACVAPDPKSRVYNIGMGTGATLKDFAAEIRKHIPAATIDIGPGLDFWGAGYPMCSVYDISRAKHELGYQPEYDLSRAVIDYLDTLRRLDLVKT
jgi:UDP-glucose 4-epimerase